MPSLVTNYQRRVLEQQFKKTYSTLKNAELRAIIDFGDTVDWDYKDAESLIKTYYVPYLNVINDTGENMLDYNVKNINGDDLGKWINNRIDTDGFIYLSDGQTIKYWSNNQFIVFTVDVNGAKGPNTYGKDIWDFELLWDAPKSLTPKGLTNINNGADYSYYYEDRCKNYTLGNGTGCFCAGLFMYNGSKFGGKYPW